MTSNFDTDLFITEIEMRPAIWDSRVAEYSNRVEKTKAWEDLCELFIPNFEEKNETEKCQATAQLQRRWKSLRDSFTRELNKIKKAKSGLASTSRKQYVYYQQLSFLSSVCEARPANEEEVSGNQESGEEDDTINQFKSNFEPVNIQPFQGNHDIPTKSDIPTKKKKRSNEEQRLIQVIAANIERKTKHQREEEDSDRHFLLSLLSDFATIPQHLKLDAKLELMNVIRKYKFEQSRPQYRKKAHSNYSSQPVNQQGSHLYPNAKVTRVYNKAASVSRQPVPSPTNSVSSENSI